MNDNNLENQNVNMNNEANLVNPVTNETPVVETAPVVEVAPVVNETPVEVAPVAEVTPAVSETPVEVAPVAEVAPVVSETPVEAAPVAEVAPVVPETPVQPTNPENVVPANGPAPVPQNGNANNDKKKLYIIIGVAALVLVIIIVLVLTVFKGDKKGGSGDYDDYVKEEQKTFEDLNKHFTYKEHKLRDSILVEINNDNKVAVMANVKVEFYDTEGKLVDVSDSSTSIIAAKGKSYAYVSTYDIEYSSYKMTVKLDEAYTNKIYVDSIEVVSASPSDDMYLYQLKNNSEVKLDIYVGILFYNNDVLVGFTNSYVSDVLAGETTSEKAYIPYDENYDNIQYTKAEVVVLSAYDI